MSGEFDDLFDYGPKSMNEKSTGRSDTSVSARVTTGNILRSRTPHMENTARDIPVIIDAVKNLEHHITRCVYFTIEAILPEAVGFLSHEGLNVPFWMLGLSGVICQPDDTSKLFEKPEQIDTLFNQVEDIEGLVVAISDTFFPTSLFNKDETEQLRGSVYRVGLELMSLSFQFRLDHIEYKQFVSKCNKLKKNIRPSTSETDVFQKWSQNQIDRSKENYGSLSKEELTLAWKEKK